MDMRFGTWYIRSLYRIGSPKKKRSLRRPRYRWEDNINMDKEIGWDSVNWIQLAQNRDHWQALVSMNHWVPYKAGNLTGRVTMNFSRRTLHHGISYGCAGRQA
jgi:hypothetical protein